MGLEMQVTLRLVPIPCKTCPNTTQYVCVAHLYRCKTSGFLQLSAGGTGVTLVPVPTKTARSHSDIKGRRPFDVPASISFHVMFLGRDVANPRTTVPFPNHFVFNFSCCTVVAICIYLFSTSWSWSTVHLMWISI